MKKVFPIALIACILLSFSGLNAAGNHTLKAPVKTAKFWWAYETDGTLTGTPYGDIVWHISPGGTIPSFITYTNKGVTYGPIAFQGSNGVYTAGGPSSLGIIYAQVANGNLSFTTIW
jgi:hypothetical protein